MATAAAMVEAAVRNQVFLERLKSGEVRKFAPFLREMDREIRERLSRADLTSFQRGRLESLLAEIDGLMLAILNRYQGELTADLVDLANYEAGFEARSLERIAPIVTTPSIEQVRSAVMTRPLSVRGAGGGQLLQTFIEDWTRAERKAVTGAIRRGFFEGQTNDQIIRAIRGTRALNYTDGVLDLTRRHAEAVVRTAVQHAASVARAETWTQNADITDGYEWVSTLDSRTTTICRTLDGKVYETGKGPLPPAHVNCRSSAVPRINDEFLQGFLDTQERASQYGPVDAKTTYYEWLKRQPVAFQNEVLGPTRGQLFRKGGLSADRFAALQLDRKFHPLTLDQMRALEPLAFERAGI